jgi:hypothetical protein
MGNLSLVQGGYKPACGEHQLGAIWGVSATNIGDLPSTFLMQGGSKESEGYIV